MSSIALENQSTLSSTDLSFSRLTRMLSRHMLAKEGMEREFLRVLQGEEVSSIGAYQVYSDHRKGESVIFIHDPTGRSEHKYIFAKTPDHTFIVAAPVSWTEYHYQILARISAACGEEAVCPGGGYVSVLDDGSLWVGGRSGDFGPGHHVLAKEALRARGECVWQVGGFMGRESSPLFTCCPPVTGPSRGGLINGMKIAGSILS